MKKLGIVLPTFNRGEYAEECVKLLLPQLLLYQKFVELLISDNASPDETESLLYPYSQKYPHIIRYVRQKENIGASANFYFGINNIETEYIYLLGDDDLVCPFFINTILSLLDTHPDIGIIHFNYLEGAKELTNIHIHHVSLFQSSFCVEYPNGRIFIKEQLVNPSFISSNVFQKQCMIEGMKKNSHSDCYGYDWLVSLYIGILEKKCLYYEMPLVVQRYGVGYEKFALDNIVGQHRIFQYIPHDKELEGIVEYWENIVKRSQSTYFSLSKIIPYKSFYKNRYSEISSCLISFNHKLCLFVSINFPSFLSRKIYSLINKWHLIKEL